MIWVQILDEASYALIGAKARSKRMNPLLKSVFILNWYTEDKLVKEFCG